MDVKEKLKKRKGFKTKKDTTKWKKEEVTPFKRGKVRNKKKKAS